MTLLHLKDHGVARARRCTPALASKPALARGTFTAVFEGSSADRVLKLTMDRSHYGYMTDGLSPKGPHKPSLLQNFGVIGQCSTGEDLFLIEVERLAPLPTSNPHTRLVRRTMRRLNRYGVSRDRAADGCTFPEEVWADKDMTGTIKSFFLKLEWFAQNYNCRLDAKFGSNYMLRPADGALVASDPVFDHALLSTYRKPAYLQH